MNTTKQVCGVEARTVYGRVTYYPTTEAAHALASIDGAKTLTRRHFEAAARLGMSVTVSDGALWDNWLDSIMDATK